MATSPSYKFTMTRDDIIGAALRLTGAFGDQDVIPSSDIANCAQALNILAKELANDGLPLWCVVDFPVALIAGQATYNLSQLTGQPRPIRLLDLYLRSETGNDVTMKIVSRYDYNTLGSKSTPGVPNQAFYDPQLGAAMITLYDVPTDATRTMHVVYQRQIQDFNLNSDNPDFPQEAFRLLKWCLADEIALEYQASGDVRNEIGMRAATYREKFFASEQEQASISFTPSERAY